MRSGLDRTTRRPLTGWAHCEQCIAVILTTRVGTRVMLRDYGSAVKALQDRNGSAAELAMLYSAIATALATWEPGFRLTAIDLVEAGREGSYSFVLSGDFYPNGHLGDYVTKEARSMVLGTTAAQITLS